MHQSADDPNNMVSGFCNPHNALFVSQNSQETNESYNIEHEHNLSNSIIEEDMIKKENSSYQDCITSDLLKQIESNSPIKNEKGKASKSELSKFSLQQHQTNLISSSANGNIPSFFPKKNNLWKQGNKRFQQGNLNSFCNDNNQLSHINDMNIHINNERYLPQMGFRNYLPPKNQCISFSTISSNEKGWVCCSCTTINSEMKNQCFRCGYFRLIPSLGSIENNPKMPSIITNQSQNDSNINTNTNQSPIQAQNQSIYNNNDATKISLTLREIAQINQMQYNQLKKINQLKELQSNENQRKYNTPILSSGLKDKFENSGINCASSNSNSNNFNKKKKKPFAERAGDWVCVKCKNLNFSFRSTCNRCQISKNENDKLYEQYMNNLMNYCKVNDMLQLKYNSPNTSFPQWISHPPVIVPPTTLMNQLKKNEDKHKDIKEEESNEKTH